MRVLALDAATEACSVALLIGGEVSVRSVDSGRSSAAQLLTMAGELLAETGLALAALDGIAASIGPGAFTGVRISVAVAQGLAFGASLRVMPVSTLEALAMQAFAAGAQHVLACLDARMGEVYWGCFAVDETAGIISLGAPRVSLPDEVRLPSSGASAPRRFRGVGRGFTAHPALSMLADLDVDEPGRRALPHAREIARLGALRLAAGAWLDPARLEPLYLRDKVALTEAERAARS